jgi:hypothetical protein
MGIIAPMVHGPVAAAGGEAPRSGPRLQLGSAHPAPGRALNAATAGSSRQDVTVRGGTGRT